MIKPKKILLIAPDFFSSYETKVRVGIQQVPPISLAVLGASLLSAGHLVDVLDLTVAEDKNKELKERLKDEYEYIGITFLTPSFVDAIKIANMVKKKQPQAVLICGGPHVSSLPEETLRQSLFDIAVIGEGEETIVEIVNDNDFGEIKGIYYKKDKRIFKNPLRPLLPNLDESPLPAWHLYDLEEYHSPRVVCRRNPVGAMETSRGCPFGCVYCNKSVFGKVFRTKSPERVVYEMEYMLRCGFREIFVYDDGFSIDMARAKRICDLIIKKDLRFPWTLHNGIRIDKVDGELLKKLKKAGCYKISFGVETGNSRVLEEIQKGTTLIQARRVFKLAEKAGVETIGFFMFGLPGDTEKTMRETIDFAKELDPDYPKASITIPLPATPMFEKLHRAGAIKTYNWREYNQQTTTEIYRHPNLKWETIYEYYSKFYKELYFRPKYIWKRIRKGIHNGQIFWDVYYFLKSLPYRW